MRPRPRPICVPIWRLNCHTGLLTARTLAQFESRQVGAVRQQVAGRASGSGLTLQNGGRSHTRVGGDRRDDACTVNRGSVMSGIDAIAFLIVTALLVWLFILKW
jgi:hypothetical protein